MNYQDAIKQGRAKWGERYVEPATTPAQRAYFNCARVEVTRTYPSGETFVRRGRISITTGWAPALLLMHRAGIIGSSDVLDTKDEITAVIDSRGRRSPVRL